MPAYGRLPVFVALLAVAGCLESEPGTPQGGEKKEHALGGAFTVDRTEADISAVCEIARTHNPECALMESFPEQFRFRFPSSAACEDARERIAAVPHTVVHACQAVPAPSTDPDASTSTSKPASSTPA